MFASVFRLFSSLPEFVGNRCYALLGCIALYCVLTHGTIGVLWLPALPTEAVARRGCRCVTMANGCFRSQLLTQQSCEPTTAIADRVMLTKNVNSKCLWPVVS